MLPERRIVIGMYRVSGCLLRVMDITEYYCLPSICGSSGNHDVSVSSRDQLHGAADRSSSNQRLTIILQGSRRNRRAIAPQPYGSHSTTRMLGYCSFRGRQGRFYIIRGVSAKEPIHGLLDVASSFINPVPRLAAHMATREV